MLDVKNYEIILVDSSDKMDNFIEFLNKLKKIKFISIDFEYTKNNIQLWQICFYIKNNNKIYVIQEKYIIKEYMEIIKNKLLLSDIIKIFSGAESLDFPYLFGILKNPEVIYKFLKNTFDVRFLCEYYQNLHDIKKKCNVYDSMLYFEAIHKEIYDKLQKINKEIGDIWKVNWNNIGKDKNLLIYTIYDVIYLKKLLLKQYKKYKKENLEEDFYNLQKANIYVLLKRFNINYDYKLNLKDYEKFRVIDYFKKIL